MNKTVSNNSQEEYRDRDVEHASDPTKTVDAVIANTREAIVSEHQLGVMDAIRIYPKAMFWCCFFAIGVIMVGYDAQIITSFFAMEAFTKHYGEPFKDGYEISAAWQSGLSMGNPIGQIVGSLAVSWPSEKFGRKKTMLFCNVLIIGIIFIQFFAPSLPVLCAGEILAGLLWGCLVVISPCYTSELAPTALRGVLEAFVNIAFVTGQLTALGVVAGTQNRDDQYAYRIPFAVQWIWPLILLGAVFAPESPYWLVRQGREGDAKKSLQRLAWVDGAEIDNALLIIQQTDELEREMQKNTSYMDIFKGTNLRRTEICALVYMIQVLCGNPLMGYYSYFFQQAGLDQSQSFYMAVGNSAIGFVGTFCSFIAVSYFGRRRIYNSVLSIMTLILFVIAILDCIPGYEQKKGLSWAQASLLDVWTFFYQLSIGPICFIIISEVSSTRLRSRTIAFATAMQSVCTIITTVCVPYMFNPQNANMRGKIGFFFGALSLLSLVWCFFRLPETQYRTFEEIDIMFEKRVRTRDFRKFNAFDDNESVHS